MEQIQESFDSMKCGMKYFILQEGSSVELGKFQVDEKTDNVILFSNMNKKVEFGLSIFKEDFGNYEVYKIKEND